MSVTEAITAFNDSCGHRIVLHPTRDGRVTATLPRLGVDVLVQGNITKTLAVTPQDLALVCREARAALTPVLALIDAALAELPQDAGDA